MAYYTYYSRYEEANKVKWTVFTCNFFRGQEKAYEVEHGFANDENSALKQADKVLKDYYQGLDVQSCFDVAEYYEDTYNKYQDDEDSYLTEYYEPSVRDTDGYKLEDDYPVVTLDYYA